MSKRTGAQNPTRDGQAYGKYLADRFGIPGAPFYVASTAWRNIIAVSDLDCSEFRSEPTESLGYDEAFLVSVNLKNVDRHEYWLGRRALNADPLIRGTTNLHDLKQDPRSLIHQPAHSVYFYLPLISLNSFAEQHGLPAITDLAYEPGRGYDDPIMWNLSRATLPALKESDGSNGLLLDQILYAVCAHVLDRYGNVKSSGAARSGGKLARWQQRRVEEMMTVGLESGVSLAELARECGLSVTHFVRAFRQTTGSSPHQWLLARRVDKAQSLLAKSELTLAQLALSCGFTDQSHFTKVFSAMVGTTPGRWRRLRGAGPLLAPLEIPEN